MAPASCAIRCCLVDTVPVPCITVMFPFNGSSFSRALPFATQWLPSVSVRHLSGATMKALRLLLLRHAGSLSGSPTLTAAALERFARSRGPEHPAHAWTLMNRCHPLRWCLQQRDQEASQVPRQPLAPLRWPATPAARVTLACSAPHARLPPFERRKHSATSHFRGSFPSASVLAVNASCQPHG